MRIVAGTAKGRKLRALRGQSTRPTAERVREALFDILGLRVEGARVLDLFAGTGALGLEALSRGAAEVLFIEKDPVAFQLLGENLALCGFGARGRLLRADVRGALRSLARKGERFDLVFLDPPYRTQLLRQCLELLGAGELLKRWAWVVAEHWGREDTPPRAGRLRRFRLSRQGEAALSFYEVAPKRVSVEIPLAGDGPKFVENKWTSATPGGPPRLDSSQAIENKVINIQGRAFKPPPATAPSPVGTRFFPQVFHAPRGPARLAHKPLSHWAQGLEGGFP